MKKADIEDGDRPGTSAVQSAELRDAKKRIEPREQQAQVLRRAAAYFSQTHLPLQLPRALRARRGTGRFAVGLRAAGGWRLVAGRDETGECVLRSVAESSVVPCACVTAWRWRAPREPWIVASSTRLRLLISSHFPRSTHSVKGNDRSVAMEILHPRCAGLDISKKDAKVCVRVAGAGSRKTAETVTTWGSMTNRILALRDHLAEQRVSCVVMEATGRFRTRERLGCGPAVC